MISSQQFLAAFAEEWQDVGHNYPSMTTPYAHRAEWTKCMVGADSVLARTARRLRSIDPTIEYRREIYTLDGVLAAGSDLFRTGLAYPSAIHALIEHELDSDVEEEMWKLIFWRAPLKVLMFYDWSDAEKAVSRERAAWLTGKMARLRAMLQTARASHAESESVEYLFLVGTRQTDFGRVDWTWSSNASPSFSALAPAASETREPQAVRASTLPSGTSDCAA